MHYFEDFIEMLFGVGLFINALIFIPQAIRIYKEKESRDVSLITFLGFLIIQFLIVLHGFIIQDYILIGGYIFSMITCGIVVFLIFYYRNLIKPSEPDEITIEDILAQIPGHVYWKDKNGVCMGSNTNNWSDFGMKSLDEFIGKTDYDLFPQDQADMLTQNDQEVMQSGKLKVMEELLDSINGQLLLSSHKVPLRNKLGEVVGIIGISVDVTNAKREMEEKLHMLESIIAMMPGSVYWMDKKGVYLGCNDIQIKLLGLNSKNELIGKKNIDMPGFFIPEVLDPVNEKVMHSGESITKEEPAILQDGTHATFISVKSPLRNLEGEVTGLVGISIDITDRKRKEELQLENEVNKKLIQEHKMFTKLISQAVHDIKSPLSTLSTLTQIPGELAKEESRITLRNVKNKIAEIANGLLNQFKTKDVESYFTKEHRTPVLVNLVLQQLLVEKKIECNELNITFESNLEDVSGLLFVRMQPLSFQRMISNLINNSIDAFKPDKAGIISLDLELQDDKYVLIKIKDNGGGIPPEVLEQIRKNQSVTHGKEDGHGIGYTQIWDTLERNSGEMELHSELGKGTCVTLKFKLEHIPSWVCTKIKLNLDDIVVILDDDESVHSVWDRYLTKLLVSNTSQIHHFHDGVDALKFIGSLNNQDKLRILFLCDYELLAQGNNGLDLIRKSHIARSILVTSHFDDEIIINRVGSMGIKLLPKQLIPQIKIGLDVATDPLERPVDLVIFGENISKLQELRSDLISDKNVCVYTKQTHLLDSLVKSPLDIKIILEQPLEAATNTFTKLQELGYSNIYLIIPDGKSKDSVPNYFKPIYESDLSKVV